MKIIDYTFTILLLHRIYLMLHSTVFYKKKIIEYKMRIFFWAKLSEYLYTFRD